MADATTQGQLSWSAKKLAGLLGVSAFFFCLWGFLELAEDVPEGRYEQRDEQILEALRDPGDAERPVGPSWLKSAMRDVSALGSEVVLTFVVVGVIGYLLLSGRGPRAAMVALACGGGALLNAGLKLLAGRPRPGVVPHLTDVASSSFPSGHSMVSAIVYLTMGLLLARDTSRRSVQVYVVAVAYGLSFLVGVSRLYLGVHYPTDVLAGWAAGAAWALLCVAVELAVVPLWVRR